MKTTRTKHEMNKMVNESDDQLKRETLKQGDNDLGLELKKRYYGVADHMDSLLKAIEKLEKGSGIFGSDLKAAKTAAKAFDKISLGKYL